MNMFLEDERKPDYPEENHISTGKASKLNAGTLRIRRPHIRKQWKRKANSRTVLMS